MASSSGATSDDPAMTHADIEPVRIGIAGVIYRSSSTSAQGPDESWVRAAFAAHGSVRRTEWRSDDIFAVTQEHVAEVGGLSGSYARPVPSAGPAHALAFGYYFGLSATQSQPIETASRVVLDAYQQGSIAGFNELNGAWAAVIWDRRLQRAGFARDGLGVQTMYSAALEDRIVFCSDLRLLRAAGLTADLDGQSAAEFLHYLYLPAPRTIAPRVHAYCPATFSGWIARRDTSVSRCRGSSRAIR